MPDLGADLVRIFSINQTSLEWTAVKPLEVTPGSGPRHATFLVTEDKRTFMYLVSELANNITGYEVAYNGDDTLGFKQVYQSSTHGAGKTAPSGAGAAEIVLSVSSSLHSPYPMYRNHTPSSLDPLYVYSSARSYGEPSATPPPC